MTHIEKRVTLTFITFVIFGKEKLLLPINRCSEVILDIRIFLN